MRRIPGKEVSRRRTAPKKSSPKPAVASTWAIILIDSSTLRRKVRRDYEKARATLAEARSLLQQYQEKDAPAFAQWLNSKFGDILTEVRETTQRLRLNEHLINMVETEAFYELCSLAQAYQNIMEELERVKAKAKADEAKANAQADDEDNKDDDHFHADAEEEARKEHAREKRSQRRVPVEPVTGPAEKLTSRLKTLYRSLVRLLHPDTQKKMSPQKVEWWHQAQSAYETGDEAQLEVILALCELEEDTSAAVTSVSVLQRIISQLRRSAREIKRQLVRYQTDPAWNFTSRTDLVRLEKRTRAALQHDLAQLRLRIASTDRLLASWKKGKKRHARMSPVPDDYLGPEWF